MAQKGYYISKYIFYKGYLYLCDTNKKIFCCYAWQRYSLIGVIFMVHCIPSEKCIFNTVHMSILGLEHLDPFASIEIYDKLLIKPSWSWQGSEVD